MGDISVRRARESDEDAVVDLLVDVMGRRRQDPNREFYRWKHQENPFGPSPSWVAEMDGRIVAFRTLMRWEFCRSGAVLRAVRAVDTVTHPDCRGKGIFRTLTMTAVEELRDEGVDFVFNTPNDASMPGYLSMGWAVVGRLPARVQSPRLGGLPRLLKSRTAAEIWSEPVGLGLPVTDVPLASLLAEEETDPVENDQRLRTRRDESFLRWRYGFAPLWYRCWLTPDERAAVVFRVRRRGAARELALLDVVGRGASVRRKDIAGLVRATGCDHGLSIDRTGDSRGLPAGSVGPMLTARQLAGAPPELPSGWRLVLGDVELF